MMPAGAAAAPIYFRDTAINSACTKSCDSAYEVAKNSTKSDLCSADSKFQNAYIPCSRCIEKRSPGAIPSDLLSYLAYCNIDVDLTTSSLRLGDGTTTTIVNVKYAPTVAATVTSSVDTDFDTAVDDTSSSEPRSKAWIAGPVFGALAGLGIILGIIYFFWRRKQPVEEEDSVSERAESHKSRSEMARSEAARSEAARSVRSGTSRRAVSTKAMSEQAKSERMSDVDAMSQRASTKHHSVKSDPDNSIHRRFSEIDSVNIHEMVGSPVLRSVAESVTESQLEGEVSTIHTRYSEIDGRNINEMLGSPGAAFFKDIPPPLPPKDKFNLSRHSEIDSNNIHEMAGSPVLHPVYEKPANEVPATEMEHLDKDELDEMPVSRKKKSRDDT